MYNHCVRFPTHTRKNDFPLSLSITQSPAHEKRVQNTHDFERDFEHERVRATSAVDVKSSTVRHRWAQCQCVWVPQCVKNKISTVLLPVCFDSILQLLANTTASLEKKLEKQKKKCSKKWNQRQNSVFQFCCISSGKSALRKSNKSDFLNHRDLI